MSTCLSFTHSEYLYFVCIHTCMTTGPLGAMGDYDCETS